MKDLSKLEKIEYHIKRIEANEPELTARLTQIHINEILELARDESSLYAKEMSMDRLEVLDDIIETFSYAPREKSMSCCYSIGIIRDDGDFHILATLNNNDGLIGTDSFEQLLTDMVTRLRDTTGEGAMIAIERQDAPDYINLEIGD